MPESQTNTESIETAEMEMARRLRQRTPEIEARLLSGLLEMYDLPAWRKTELIAGAQVVVRDVVAFSMTAFEGGEEWAEPMPTSFGDQARYAVHIGMTLEELLRGYSLGNTVIAEFVAEELQSTARPEILISGVGIQSRVAEALISGLSSEYAKEAARLDSSPAVKLLRRVEQLLDDEAISDANIGYRLDAWHIAAIVSGREGERLAQLLSGKLGCELLLLPRSAEVFWMWLGAKAEIPFARFQRVALELDAPALLAIGEARHGADGFRASHREAQIASAVMVRRKERLTRCADVMLAGIMLQEPALGTLYLTTYLGPLKADRSWASLRDTLRAYFEAQGNLASASAALGVDRHTVRRRLGKVEAIIKCPLEERRAELEVALRLDDLSSTSLARPAL
jgi:hypothetical protein